MKLQACKGTPDLTVPNRVADVSLDFPTGSPKEPTELKFRSVPVLTRPGDPAAPAAEISRCLCGGTAIW